MCLCAAAGCNAGIPVPSVKEGEFNFSVTYQANGKTETIQGTYVCEFVKAEKVIDGINREWKGCIKGHEESDEYLIATVEDGSIFLDPDLSPEYFMADPFYKSNKNTDAPAPEPVLFIRYTDPDKIEQFGEGSSDVSAYDVKIISFEYDKPIENTYE